MVPMGPAFVTIVRRGSVMAQFLRSVSLVFAAGVFGALLNSVAAWLFGAFGVTAALGIKMAPALTPEWLYPRLVWGGLWGVLFLLPVLRDAPVLRGLLWSVGPTLVQLFVVFPLKAHKGTAGLDLGIMTPLLVVVLNAIWGIAAALWLYVTEERTNKWWKTVWKA